MRSSALFLIGAKLIGFSHSLHKYLFFHLIILIIAAEIKGGHGYLPKSGAGCFAFPSVLAKLFSQVWGAIGDRSCYSIMPPHWWHPISRCIPSYTSTWWIFLSWKETPQIYLLSKTPEVMMKKWWHKLLVAPLDHIRIMKIWVSVSSCEVERNNGKFKRMEKVKWKEL